MFSEFDPVNVEQLFGGVSHDKQIVLPGVSWATLELAYDTYSIEHIASILDSFNPDSSRTQLQSPRSRSRVSEYLARFGNTYCLVIGDEVQIVGDDSIVNKIGPAVILQRKLGASGRGQFKEKSPDSLSWQRVHLETDTIIAGDLTAAVRRLSNYATVESLVPLNPESGSFLARVGQDNYLKVLPAEIDIVGSVEGVDLVSQILEPVYLGSSRGIHNFCEGPFRIR